MPTTNFKHQGIFARIAIAAIGAAMLSACGSGGDVDDASGANAQGSDAFPDREPGVYTEGRANSGIALPELSAELRQAAEKSGDLACGLPLIPDHSDGKVIGDNQKDASFNTGIPAEQVAAFYQAAALKKVADVTTSGASGEIRQHIAMPDMRKCDVLAETNASGGSEVTVRFAYSAK